MAMITLSWTALLIGYVAVYIGCTVLVLIIRRKRRKTKWPFKESDHLLRGPGESLRRKIQEFDETVALEFIGVVVAVSVTWLVAAYLVRALQPSAWLAWTIFIGMPLVPIVLAALRMGCLFTRRSNWLLGWFGERLTAENLRPLQLQGYHVFHDVPAEPGKKGFNIDHVVVGPNGVTVIEVKTRRKGNARPGRKDHEVTFDGRQLSWPWGEDRHGIQQALNEAEWLRRWIENRTGLKVPVRAVLTLPGWWVTESPSPDLRVVNPKVLPDAIRGRWPNSLASTQVDLIARQLEVICRDVSD